MRRMTRALDEREQAIIRHLSLKLLQAATGPSLGARGVGHADLWYGKLSDQWLKPCDQLNPPGSSRRSTTTFRTVACSPSSG